MFQAGVLLFIFADVINVLKAQGYVTVAGEFVKAKFDDVKSDLVLASAIEAVLKTHGVDVPTKVDKVIALIPALADIFVA